MIKTALSLARMGLPVFPCVQAGKAPACAHGCKDATTDAEQIREWWSENPNYNVAIATGTKVFVVDLDGAHAEFQLAKLEAAHGTLPPTVEVITPRPGRHLYFQASGLSVRNTASRIAPGIDTRGLNGYVLTPPSIHPSGKAYAWSVDSADAFAEAPQWLLDKITERSNGNGTIATPPEEWRALVAAGVDEGQRDCSIAKLAGHLLRRFVDPHVTLDLVQCWNMTRCRPPLPEQDIYRIVNSISGKERQRRGHA